MHHAGPGLNRGDQGDHRRQKSVILNLSEVAAHGCNAQFVKQVVMEIQEKYREQGPKWVLVVLFFAFALVQPPVLRSEVAEFDDLRVKWYLSYACIVILQKLFVEGKMETRVWRFQHHASLSLCSSFF